MTLALLLTAVTGAWADGTVYNSSVDVHTLQPDDILIEGAAITGITSSYGPKIVGYYLQSEDDEHYSKYNSTRALAGSDAQVTLLAGGVIEYLRTSSSSRYTYTPCDAEYNPLNAWIVTQIEDLGSGSYRVQITAYQYEPAEPAIDVKWDAETKTGSFEMPAYDVEIAPIYAPAAKWATDGNQVLTPTAIEGIYAESTDAIVKAGTVAKIGETENVQGTLMYAVGTSATEQPALTAFSATLPTAKDITAAGDVYVWYYIKGADAPQGETATAENTFNDSEICAEPLKVTVLSNKFDIQFNAANANTIEAGKATVTVGGTAATVTEGKLEGGKMGSEVKVTAKEGYKFRKVEATKGISTLKSVKIGNYTVYYAEGETWYQAFWRDENKNCGLETSVGRVFTYNDKSLRDSDGDVYADAVINPSKGYYIAD